MLCQHANPGRGVGVSIGENIDIGECGEASHSIWMLCTIDSRESGIVNGMQKKKTMLEIIFGG